MRRWRTQRPTAIGPASVTRRKRRVHRRSRIRLVGGRRLDIGWRDHTQKIDAAAIGAQHAKLQLADLNGLSAARQPPELLHQQAADGVEFLVGKRSPEVLIEIRDGSERAHREFTRAFPADRLIVFDVVLIVDLADDLFDDILDGDQSAHTAILIDDHGDVIVAAAKFLEQDVEPFALGNEHHRTHVFANLEVLVARNLQAQQILRQQDPENLIAVFADHGEARMPGFDYQLDELIGGLVALDEHHLRARHHDVAYLHVRHRQHTLEHYQRVAVEQATLTGFAQILDEFGEIARLTGHRLGNAF